MPDPPPSKAPALALFARPSSAFAAVIVLLTTVSVAYVLVHLFRTRPEWPVATSIAIDQDSFAYDFNKERLVPYLSSEKIDELEEGLRADEKRYTESSSRWRQQNLRRLSMRLDRLERSNPLSRSLDTTGDILETKPLRALVSELESLVSAGVLQRVDAGFARQIDWEIESLRARVALEDQQRTRMKAQVGALDPPLTFRWLYHRQSGWIFEVAFWTIVGLLCNTMIALISASKTGGYRPELFLLLFPKLAIAPVLSIVIVALFSSGNGQYEISVLNLPMFLVLAFILGFASEGLYDKIRDISNVILPSVAIDEGQLASERRRSLSSLVQLRKRELRPTEMASPETTEDLRRDLERLIAPRVQNALVAGEEERRRRAAEGESRLTRNRRAEIRT
ncbi:MAG: hypothetical protein AAGB93_13885 [Planctomycetota bacterium]